MPDLSFIALSSVFLTITVEYNSKPVLSSDCMYMASFFVSYNRYGEYLYPLQCILNNFVRVCRPT